MYEKILNKIYLDFQKKYCRYKYFTSPKISNKKALATIFFDYEGEWAKIEQKSNSLVGVNHILNTLHKLNFKATFNTVGKLFEKEDIIDKIMNAKHEIASHYRS